MKDELFFALNPSLCSGLSKKEAMEILEKLNVASCYILDFVSGDADEEETLDAVEFAGVDMDTWLISAQSNLSFFGYE